MRKWTQRGRATCPRSHSREATEERCEPGQSDSRTQALTHYGTRVAVRVICAKQTVNRHEMFTIIIIITMILPNWLLSALLDLYFPQLLKNLDKASSSLCSPSVFLSAGHQASQTSLNFTLPSSSSPRRGQGAPCCWLHPHTATQTINRPNPLMSLLCANPAVAPQRPQDNREIPSPPRP